MSELINELEGLVTSYRSLIDRLEYARGHILEYIKAFPAEKIRCMVSDGILNDKDLPPDILEEVNKLRGLK